MADDMDMDMPDLEGMAPEAAARHQPSAAASEDGLDEEDELELALEAELDAAADQQQDQQQQAAVQVPVGAALQDAARAAAAATAALQQEEEELPLTADGFLDLDRMTSKQHQRYNTLVGEILTEQQLDRYSAFRRSSLRKGIQLLVSKTLGGIPNSKAIIALSSVTKSFVDDLVATAMAVVEERGESTPLQPAHIHEAYQRLIEQDKVPGKTARRRAFFSQDPAAALCTSGRVPAAAMTAISVTSVNVLDNPSKVTNPLQFEIQYECMFDLADDLEWKLTYVGSAESEKYDQVLDTVFVGPVAPGQYRFVFQADPPTFDQIPPDDIVGVTVILLTCSYKAQEFLRVGYYVNNEYTEDELRENPPDAPLLDRLHRNILADKPRVTKFNIDWDSERATSGLQSGMEVDS
ncbi:Histone chaperone asf1 [Chlorella vulgaris]